MSKSSLNLLATVLFPILSCICGAAILSCADGGLPGTGGLDPESNGAIAGLASSVAGHELATQAVLRAIPAARVAAARKNLSVAYQHTSHGTHVAYGLFGLPGFKTGDGVSFGITDNASTRDPDKLDFHDYAIAPSEYCDLSTSDNGGWASWLTRNRSYLDDPANASINVVMWSWCSIGGHDVPGYLGSMQTLIDEYGPGGGKIGSGTGKTRTTPVTFVFMTGHAETGSNVGAGRPKDQAKLITDYCAARGYWCLDYYSIDSHDMDGNYYEDASDDSDSATYAVSYNASHGTSFPSRKFYADWQDARAKGVDWYENRSSPGGSAEVGAHNSQHLTANRKAYAMWYLMSRIAGWDGKSAD